MRSALSQIPPPGQAPAPPNRRDPPARHTRIHLPDGPSVHPHGQRPSPTATIQRIHQRAAKVRQDAYDRRLSKGNSIVSWSVHRLRHGSTAVTEPGTVISYRLPPISEFPVESQTARTWSHRFGKQERYIIRWTAPGDTSTVGWAQLKKLHDAVASDPATQTTHRQQPRAATDECAAAAFSALTGSTVSSDQLRYRYPACVTRTDEGHGFTVNWMLLLQTYYGTVPGHWMIHPIRTDAQLRLMFGGIGDTGRQPSLTTGHCVHVAPPLSGIECSISKCSIALLNGKYRRSPDTRFDHAVYINHTKATTLHWEPSARADHVGRWIISSSTGTTLASEPMRPPDTGSHTQPGTTWLIRQSNRFIDDPALRFSKNRASIDRTKYRFLWGVLPAHDPAAANTVNPSHGEDEDDAPLHQVPGLYRHNEAGRSASVAKALQRNRVLAALPQHGTTAATDAIAAAGGADMPGRPELYCTEQLDHITQQQSAMFEAQRNATRMAITEIDMYDNPVGSYSREWQRFCDWDAASGNSLVASRTKLNEAIPYFSLNRLRGFAGYLLEWYGRANLLSYQSAINFYYQNHGYAKPWTGGRCRRLCNAYTTAREARARANGEKGGGLREEICETAVQWMLSNADSQTDPIRRGRMLVVLIMILGFFRANTIGALESEDDIAFDQLGNLRIIIRALKGHKLAAPNIMTIVAVPEHTNRSRASEGRPLHARTQLFESIRKAKAEGIALNLCRSASSAHDQITDWFSPADGKGENLLPESIANLREGGFHSSHSGRRTGASGAANSGTAFKEGIKVHGGWKSTSSAELYCNEDYKVQHNGVIRQLFDFLKRNAS